MRRRNDIKEGRDAADDLVSDHSRCHPRHQSLLRVFYSLTDNGACLKCFPVTYLFHPEGPKPQYIPYINILSVVLQQFTSCFLWATRSLLCNYHQFSCFKGQAYAALIMSKQVHVAGAEHYMYIHVPSSVAQYVECPFQDREAPGSIPRHTKVVDNVTSCSPLGTKIFGAGLGLSVLCDWGGIK